MMKEYNYRSVMQVPKLDKIALNVSVGDAKEDNKAIDSVVKDITIISGQKPVVTRARKAIAGFKIRQGMPIGVSVTLRGNRMGYFFERLLNASLPRIRDFRGLSRSSFDGRGNYSIGIKEQVTFPEIDYNQVDRIRGLQVTICTTAKTDAEGARFLELLGMPFVREG
jgi:large subunit ribosomal protein L5